MAHVTGITGIPAYHPAVRKLSLSDLKDAIARGFADFLAKPTFGLYIVLIYPLVTLAAFLVVFRYDWLPMVFPTISGLLLLGPFITVGMCEISRRREAGLDISGLRALDFRQSASSHDVTLLGVLLMVLFFLWLGTAMTIYGLTLGNSWQVAPQELGANFMQRLFTTEQGWMLIVAGNAIGLVFALITLCVGTISVPLLLDKPAGLANAVQTSIRVVAANPAMMMVWGLIVVATMVLGAIPLLLGLSVTIPVMGHATWHLYRKAVA